jgi:putative transposase
MFRSLKKAVIERAMSAELTEHLGYGPGQVKPDGQRNHRNGASPKTDRSGSRFLEIDRAASSRRSSASTSAASPASTRRSW